MALTDGDRKWLGDEFKTTHKRISEVKKEVQDIKGGAIVDDMRIKALEVTLGNHINVKKEGHYTCPNLQVHNEKSHSGKALKRYIITVGGILGAIAVIGTALMWLFTLLAGGGK